MSLSEYIVKSNGMTNLPHKIYLILYEKKDFPNNFLYLGQRKKKWKWKIVYEWALLLIVPFFSGSFQIFRFQISDFSISQYPYGRI